MIYKLLPLLFTSLLLLQCKDKDKATDYPSEYGKLKIVWRTPFEKGKYLGSKTPVLYGDKVVFSNFSTEEPEKLIAYDAETGKKEFWRWDDYINSNATNISSTRTPLTKDNKLFLAIANGIIAINLDNGQTIWKNNFTASGRTKIFNNTIIRPGSDFFSNDIFVKMIDIETGAERTILYQDTITTQFANFVEPEIVIESNNDTIIYLGLNEIFQQPDGAINVFGEYFAYNLTQDSIVWRRKGIAPFTVLDGDRIYAISDKIYCIDRKTGASIWETNYPEKAGGYINLFEGKVIITGQGSPTYVQAYNASDGAPLWKIPFGGNTSQPVYHNGIMYFTASSDGKLWAIRVANGERIWHESCPDTEQDSGSIWSFGVNVDPATNKVYAASFTGAFCLEAAR